MTATPDAGSALDRWEVADLVDTWFRRLTDKADVTEMLGFLDPDDLEMEFPEGTVSGTAGFREWYATVTATFFDQVHELRVLDVACHGAEADVRLVVTWQARLWTPPAAYSGWTGADARQHWRVRRAGDGRAVISRYRVLSFDPVAGPRRIPF